MGDVPGFAGITGFVSYHVRKMAEKKREEMTNMRDGPGMNPVIPVNPDSRETSARPIEQLVSRNDSYVIERLNRWCVYMHWLTRQPGTMRHGHRPHGMRSWWGPLVLDPNMGSDSPTAVRGA